VRPLGTDRMHSLTYNGSQVLDRLVADTAFVTELVNAGSITWAQREHLINIIQPRDRNRQLIDFLTRRSVANFKAFIKVLSKEQDYLVEQFLREGGEIGYVQYWSADC